MCCCCCAAAVLLLLLLLLLPTTPLMRLQLLQLRIMMMNRQKCP